MCHKCTPSIQSENEFSVDGKRRYWLRRQWNPRQPTLVALLANPTPLDPKGANPTLRAVMAIACHNGYGAVEVMNLDPRISLANVPSAIQDPRNDALIQQRCFGKTVWLAWGNCTMVTQLPRAPKNLVCIGQTRAGNPLHPARKSHKLTLRPWPNPV